MLAFFDNSAVMVVRGLDSLPMIRAYLRDARHRITKRRLYKPLRGRRSSVPMKHGPIEAKMHALRWWKGRESSVPMKHGPIEACRGRGGGCVPGRLPCR